MPIADWSVPFELTSALYSASTLPLNQQIPGGGIYLLRPDGCFLRTSVRSTKEDVPQADGSILHTRYLTGMEMQLTVQLWETDDEAACGSLLQTMLDDIMGYLRALLNAGDNEGRISWTPTGQTNRMLDDVRLLSYPEETLSAGGIYELGFTIDTRFPYSMELTETQVVLDASEVVANVGNTDTYPVIRLDGPFTVALLDNTTTGKVWRYDSSRLGAAAVDVGDYIEIDMFRNTVFLNGNQDNMMAGVDPEVSTFFPLAPGNNTITLAGPASGLAKVNGAWA